MRLFREASGDASQGELSLPPHHPHTLETTTNPGNLPPSSRLAGTFILTSL